MVIESDQNNTNDKAAYLQIVDRPNWSLEKAFQLVTKDRDLTHQVLNANGKVVQQFPQAVKRFLGKERDS
jgi:hypothetical protein